MILKHYPLTVMMAGEMMLKYDLLSQRGVLSQTVDNARDIVLRAQTKRKTRKEECSTGGGTEQDKENGATRDHTCYGWRGWQGALVVVRLCSGAGTSGGRNGA